MQKISTRQQEILKFIMGKKRASNSEIREYLKNKHGELSRYTIIRDAEALLKNRLIEEAGRGRSLKYQKFTESELLDFIAVDEYFADPPDKRNGRDRFNIEIFGLLSPLFTKTELDELNNLNNEYRNRIKKCPPAIKRKEFERLTTELSWKSSSIEGNTYSLIDTEILIKENKEAAGHKRKEAVMILNHKKALDHIRDKKSSYKKLTLRKIENIHELLTGGLDIKRGLRNAPAGITGTKYKPYDNSHQIRDAMENLIKAANRIKEPFSLAIIMILMISYIQPFEDGNKRTGRLLGDAILLANNICPLSYRSIDAGEYKKSVLLFYEKNSLRYFKELFVEQFKFAVSNYF